MPDKPSVLFGCGHNAGRSQVAAAFMTNLSKGPVEVRSAGSEPADQVNPVVAQAMTEVGVAIAVVKPRLRDEIKRRVQALCTTLLPTRS
jgi:arsenate reductase (thioredoxin)